MRRAGRGVEPVSVNFAEQRLHVRAELLGAAEDGNSVSTDDLQPAAPPTIAGPNVETVPQIPRAS
jgi:hypothetical protein